MTRVSLVEAYDNKDVIKQISDLWDLVRDFNPNVIYDINSQIAVLRQSVEVNDETDRLQSSQISQLNSDTVRELLLQTAGNGGIKALAVRNDGTTLSTETVNMKQVTSAVLVPGSATNIFRLVLNRSDGSQVITNDIELGVSDIEDIHITGIELIEDSEQHRLQVKVLRSDGTYVISNNVPYDYPNTANMYELGLVLSSTVAGNVYVNADGTMTVNGFAQLSDRTTAQENELSALKDRVTSAEEELLNKQPAGSYVTTNGLESELDNRLTPITAELDDHAGDISALEADTIRLRTDVDGKQPAGDYATVTALTDGLSGKQDSLTAGAGVSIINNVISADPGLKVTIVDTLPETGISTVIYLVPVTGGEDNYDEYIYVNNAWELIGSTRIDLSEYALKSDVEDVENSLTEYLKKGDNTNTALYIGRSSNDNRVSVTPEYISLSNNILLNDNRLDMRPDEVRFYKGGSYKTSLGQFGYQYANQQNTVNSSGTLTSVLIQKSLMTDELEVSRENLRSTEEGFDTTSLYASYVNPDAVTVSNTDSSGYRTAASLRTSGYSSALVGYAGSNYVTYELVGDIDTQSNRLLRVVDIAQGDNITITRQANGLKISATGGSGTPTWGNITGTLSAQTDLQTALDSKQPVGDYVTGVDLINTLSNYPTNSALNYGLSLKQDVGDYVTTSALDDTLSSYATTEDLTTQVSAATANIDTKVAKFQGVENEGKILKVDSEGNLVLADPPEPSVSSGTGQDVLFFDWDGGILYHYSKEEFLALDSMPALPEDYSVIHYQEWNWTWEEAVAYVTKHGMVDVGVVVGSSDGNCHVWYRPRYFNSNNNPSDTNGYMKLTAGSVIDWGDGSSSATKYFTTDPKKLMHGVFSPDAIPNERLIACCYVIIWGNGVADTTLALATSSYSYGGLSSTAGYMCIPKELTETNIFNVQNLYAEHINFPRGASLISSGSGAKVNKCVYPGNLPNIPYQFHYNVSNPQPRLILPDDALLTTGSATARFSYGGYVKVGDILPLAAPAGFYYNNNVRPIYDFSTTTSSWVGTMSHSSASVLPVVIPNSQNLPTTASAYETVTDLSDCPVRF